jgi:stalled ribosome alternative rescue factor ArfA
LQKIYRKGKEKQWTQKQQYSRKAEKNGKEFVVQSPTLVETSVTENDHQSCPYNQDVIFIVSKPLHLQNYPTFSERKGSHKRSGKKNTSHNGSTCGFDKHCTT